MIGYEGTKCTKKYPNDKDICMKFYLHILHAYCHHEADQKLLDK